MGTWGNLLKDDPDEFADSLKCAVQADVFLLAAVDSAGIDWCIARLRDVKRKKGKIEAILDIAIPSSAKKSTDPTPTAIDQP